MKKTNLAGKDIAMSGTVKCQRCAAVIMYTSFSQRDSPLGNLRVFKSSSEVVALAYQMPNPAWQVLCVPCDQKSRAEMSKHAPDYDKIRVEGIDHFKYGGR